MGWKSLGVVAAIVLMFPGRLAAQSVVVRTYNNYGVPAKDLRIARESAEAILKGAGIDVSWLECWHVDAEPADASPQCRQPWSGNELVLRLTPANPAPGKQYVAMGYSMVNLAEGQPFLATIYADLVGSVARSAGVDARSLLGRAIAHEIGHLLLGTNQHSETGLMRATWTRTDLRRKDGPGWQFQDAEAQAMRRTIAARTLSSLVVSR